MNRDELVNAIATTNAKALILSSEFIPDILAIKDRIPKVEHFIVAGGPSTEGMLSYDDMIARSPDRMPDTRFIVTLNPCTGGTVVIMKKFDPEESLRLIEKERINWVFMVPTMLEKILSLPDEVKNKYDLSAMHTVICAAAPPPRSLNGA